MKKLAGVYDVDTLFERIAPKNPRYPIAAQGFLQCDERGTPLALTPSEKNFEPGGTRGNLVVGVGLTSTPFENLIPTPTR
jgi:hypothetical protein